jgi:phage tail-like protein
VATDTAQLIIRLPDQTERTVSLSSAVMMIGRNPDSAISLPHPLVSRNHAELRLDPQGWILTDLGSVNGTFIAGTRLLANQPLLLAPGTEIHIGPFVLIYQAAEQAAIIDEPPIEPARRSSEQSAPPATQTDTPTLDTPALEEVAQLEPSQAQQETPAPPAAEMPPLALKPVTHAGPPIPPPPPERSERAEPVPLKMFVAPIARPPILPSWNQGSRYLRNLPGIFQDNEFLGRYLLIFESIWEPLESRQNHIEMYVDAHTCPASFLAWLAGWLGLALNTHWPESRRRLLLAEAMDLYRWRGTSYGLTRMIEVCTGLTPEISDGQGQEDSSAYQPFVFRIRITIPPESGVDPGFIEELVRSHKPAHAGYILEIRT